MNKEAWHSVPAENFNRSLLASDVPQRDAAYLSYRHWFQSCSDRDTQQLQRPGSDRNLARIGSASTSQAKCSSMRAKVCDPGHLPPLTREPLSFALWEPSMSLRQADTLYVRHMQERGARLACVPDWIGLTLRTMVPAEMLYVFVWPRTRWVYGTVPRTGRGKETI